MPTRKLITYDARKPGQNYAALWEALRRISAQRSCESVWIVRSIYSTSQIANYLKQYIDYNDRLLVTEISDWTSVNSMTNITNI